jgi:hypothetical protein
METFPKTRLGADRAHCIGNTYHLVRNFQLHPFLGKAYLCGIGIIWDPVVKSMAKAFLISPADRSIESIELSDLKEVAGLVGFDTIESDDIGNGIDRLFFDEECFIRGASGRFQIDKLIPVAGKGVLAGVSADGATLTDASVSRDELLKRTRFE